MALPRIQTRSVLSKDRLVKVLATVFLNPADPDNQGKKTFIQGFLGCGCPDEVVAQARISFFVRPLGSYLEDRIALLDRSEASTPLEQETNRLLKIPRNVKWPRRPSGELIAPALWRRPMLEAVAGSRKNAEQLGRLRSMSNAVIDVVIEVPGRAFFFLVAQEKRRLRKDALMVQYESGQLLYQLMGYNRCRLFTVTQEQEPKRIPEIDTALTWQGLRDAFFEARDRYAFADLVLGVFDPVAREMGIAPGR